MMSLAEVGGRLCPCGRCGAKRSKNGSLGSKCGTRVLGRVGFVHRDRLLSKDLAGEATSIIPFTLSNIFLAQF